MTTTLIRVPDQFSPGAGAVATAATPTCCCCCCCVTSLVVTSAVLAEGLNADLRQAERRSPAAVILIALGPLIAVVPLLVMVVGSSSWLSRLFSAQLGSAELVAVLVAALWTLAIPVASGASRPFAGLLRLGVGVVLWITEFILAAFTLMTVELIGLVLIPVIIINLRQFYRRANRR